MTYSIYKKRFEQFMEENKMEHTTYDTRHTFATECSSVGIPDVTIKRLLGHSLSNDVTNDVYIHKTIEELQKEVEKIKY